MAQSKKFALFSTRRFKVFRHDWYFAQRPLHGNSYPNLYVISMGDEKIR